jgi:uncharacterized protein YbbC (DUF1343 family)
MRWKPGFSLILIFFIFSNCSDAQENKPVLVEYNQVITGAQRTEIYLPLLKNRKIGVVANPASVIGTIHLVDSLISLKIDIEKIFCPEHGFRGDVPDGEEINNEIDPKTGIKIISLYGKNKKVTNENIADLDVIVFDLQDVGCRFFTYISTLTYVMQACADNGIPLIILDRPNPNGFYVDGPILEKGFESFIGMHPIPVVYGMTIGEYAQMVNGENWLENGNKCDLTVIQLDGYMHNMIVKLPIKPSPNLPNWQAVYLYPSLCFFEGTAMSVGRGTDFPFQIYGSPNFSLGSFAFTPESKPGASTNPKYQGQQCFGQNLTGYAENYQNNPQQINLMWLIESYNLLDPNEKYFTSYFDKLAGTDKLRLQIEAGKIEDEIRESWEEGLIQFKETREKYLLYE